MARTPEFGGQSILRDLESLCLPWFLSCLWLSLWRFMIHIFFLVYPTTFYIFEFNTTAKVHDMSGVLLRAE